LSDTPETPPQGKPDKAAPARRKTRPIRRVRNQVAAKVRDAESYARSSQRKRVRAMLYVWRVTVQVVTQWRRDRCPQHAAGLSFQLLLSIVPALAVVFAAVRWTGAMGAESALVEFLSREFLPLSQEEISSKLLSWSENINFQSMGIVGLVAVLLIAFITFNALEHTVNHIWRVEKRRGLTKRLVTFYLSASIGPLFFGLSLYQAAQFGLTEGWTGLGFSAGLAFCGLFFINWILPATPVKASAAAVGALFNTIAVEVAKHGFTLYVSAYAMDRYSGIYGTVAIVPLFLIWIYWSWLMLLLGVEISHTVQNLHLMERAERRITISLADELENHVNASTGLRITAAIAAAQAHGEPGLSRYRIGQDFGLSSDAVRIITNRLQDHDILRAPTSDDNWSLARDAGAINVLQVFDSFRTSAEFSDPEKLGASPAEAVLRELATGSRERAAEVSIADIAADVLAEELDAGAD
jgi:membrane protein